MKVLFLFNYNSNEHEISETKYEGKDAEKLESSNIAGGNVK